MEIKLGDYVRYKGKVYSVAWDSLGERNSFDLINYKDLEILKNIPKSELEKLTDFHVSVMRYNKELPKRRFKIGDMIRIRAGIQPGGFWENSCLEWNKNYVIDEVDYYVVEFNNWDLHEFEVELVEEN